VAVAFVVLLAGCARPVAPAPLKAPAGLGFFVGTWELRGEDPSTGKRFEMEYVIRPVLGGAWLEGHGASEALGVEVRDYWGYDGVTGEIVRVILQSDGVLGTVRSRGWQGDTLVLEGDARQKPAPVHVRETIRREGPAKFTATWEAEANGKWVTYSVEKLRRLP
jgi:hypothetical protein